MDGSTAGGAGDGAYIGEPLWSSLDEPARREQRPPSCIGKTSLHRRAWAVRCILLW